MQQIIQLNPDDDIATIRARVEMAEFSHVVLVVPRDCVVLERERGLELVRRAADDLGAQVALVAHDSFARRRAEEFGFPVFNSIAQAQRARWRMQSWARAHAPRVTHAPDSAPETARPFAGLSRDLTEWRGALLAMAGAALLFCLAAFFLTPTAQVRIVPSSVALALNTDVGIDSSAPQVNPETRVIPARRLLREISGTLQLRTTTTKTIPDARATGTVIFTNLRVDETEIPQGTIVKTSAGVPIRFTTLTTVTLPAGLNSRVEAPVQAVDPGPSGNVKELAINAIEGSQSLQARVINTQPMVSGNVRPVRVVTADDKRKLEDQLLQQLRQQAPAELRASLKPDEFLPPDSIQVEVNDKLFDRAVDEPADVLSLKMTAEAFGLAVAQTDLESAMRWVLQKQMQPGYQLLPNGVKVEVLAGGKYQGIQLRQPIRALGYTTPLIDASKVASALQGKSVDEAKAFLRERLNLAQPPDIRVAPPGWFRMPWFAFRIAVFVEQPTVGK
jgi:hypothetical protein